MLYWRVLVCVATIISSLTPINDATSTREIEESDAVLPGWQWPFRPHLIRRLTLTEIDEFNHQGLHDKRSKFIGRSSVDADNGPVIVTSRGAQRKRSDGNDIRDMIQRATRSRKFVGKRGRRKFLGRRSVRQVDASKRGRRKFVG